MTVEEDVLRKIVPTAEDRERIRSVADRLVKIIRKYMDAHGIVADLKLVGSYSKDTYLSNPDLDLFMMFPPGTSRETLTTVGLKIGEDVLHGVRMYAEHPYTSAVFEGVDVDLVPNIHVPDTKHLATAVDRTPFHTEYVRKAMKPGQNDQIRLLKKFMKGIGTYGAEPNARGFSGYLCELLVLRYGSFREVLTAASKNWEENTQLSLSDDHIRLEGALVFYDPVDGRRNVAAAVHVDTLGKFIAAAKAYLAEPSERFFFPRTLEHLSREQLTSICSNMDSRILSVRFDKPDTVDDNLYAQLWRTRYALEAKLNSNGFKVIRAVQKVDASGMEIMFLLERDRLPDSELRIGPAVWEPGVENFLNKWKSQAKIAPFLQDGKWCALVPRRYVSAKDMVLTEIQHAGVGKEIDISSMSVSEHDETLELGGRGLLTHLLDPRPPWEY